MEREEIEKDRFEISFRVLGNEIFGMEVMSQSRLKNWAFFGLITLAAVSILFSQLAPSVISLVDMLNDTAGDV